MKNSLNIKHKWHYYAALSFLPLPFFLSPKISVTWLNVSREVSQWLYLYGTFYDHRDTREIDYKNQKKRKGKKASGTLLCGDSTNHRSTRVSPHRNKSHRFAEVTCVSPSIGINPNRALTWWNHIEPIAPHWQSRILNMHRITWDTGSKTARYRQPNMARIHITRTLQLEYRRSRMPTRNDFYSTTITTTTSTTTITTDTSRKCDDNDDKDNDDDDNDDDDGNEQVNDVDRYFDGTTRLRLSFSLSFSYPLAIPLYPPFR